MIPKRRALEECCATERYFPLKTSTRCASLLVAFITLGAALSTLAPVAEAQRRVKPAVSQPVPRSGSQVQALLDQAASARLHGQMEKAMHLYAEAVKLASALKDRRREAAALNGIGAVYSKTGQPQKALDFYQQALPIRKAVGDKAGEARTLSNIGAVYSGIGQPQKALDFYQQALPLARAAGDKAVEAAALNGIGAVYSDTGQPQKALAFY